MSVPNFSKLFTSNTNNTGNGAGGSGNSTGVDNLLKGTTGSETGHPGITSSGTKVEADTVNQTQNAVDEIEADKQHATDQYADFTQQQYDTPGTQLNQWQNSDYARDGGQYGRANNRTYDQTLRLSREADAYNNKPIEKTRRVSGTRTTGAVNVSWETPYDRPKIETEEMREMQKSRQLDLNQKQLAQNLQAAVNQKNLDAFRNYWQAMFGITLNAFQAEQQMRVFNRQQHIYNTIVKDKASFDRYLKLHFDQLTANVIYRVSLKNPAVGMYLAPLAMGYPMADLDTTMDKVLENAIFTEAMNMFPNDPARARQAAHDTMRATGISQAKSENSYIRTNTP